MIVIARRCHGEMDVNKRVKRLTVRAYQVILAMKAQLISPVFKLDVSPLLATAIGVGFSGNLTAVRAGECNGQSCYRLASSRVEYMTG